MKESLIPNPPPPPPPMMMFCWLLVLSASVHWVDYTSRRRSKLVQYRVKKTYKIKYTHNWNQKKCPKLRLHYN